LKLFELDGMNDCRRIKLKNYDVQGAEVLTMLADLLAGSRNGVSNVGLEAI
jgi:hypothetical protein